MQYNTYQISEEELKELIRLYTVEKKSLKYLSKVFHRDLSTISKKFKQLNIPINNTKNFQDLSGKRFGKLVVIKRLPDDIINNNKKILYHVRWECKCDCGNIHSARSSTLKNKNCLSCGCSRYKYIYKGYKNLSQSYWRIINTGAKYRKLDITISIMYAWELFEQQNRRCALSGREIHIERNYSKKRKLQTASLDRIDSSKGYIKGNIQWVHKDFNKLKHNLTQEKFIKMCKEVAENFKG